MKRLFILFLILNPITLIAGIQIPSYVDYAYSIPYLIAKDSLFMKDLYTVLVKSSNHERKLFNELPYFEMEINKNSQHMEVVIEAGMTPPSHAPIGYSQYCNKYFMLNGSGVINLFDSKKEDHFFQGKIPIDFDDRYLLWILKYENGNWYLLEYPDKSR